MSDIVVSDSDIVVSDSDMFGGGAAACRGVMRFGGGVGLQPGLESKVVKAVYARSIFNIFMLSAGPLCQVTKSSQPLFYSCWDQQGWIGWLS